MFKIGDTCYMEVYDSGNNCSIVEGVIDLLPDDNAGYYSVKFDNGATTDQDKPPHATWDDAARDLIRQVTEDLQTRSGLKF
jgi:hypothetical protein